MRNIVIVDASSTGTNYIGDVQHRNCRPVVLEPHLEPSADPVLFEERIQLRRRYADGAEFLEEKEDYAETLEMIRALEQVSGKQVPYRIAPRRDGDPAALVASNEKAKKILGWIPEHSEITEILADAWNWENNRRY